MSEPVLVERQSGVATVSLNRPDRMNSLTTELMDALAQRLREVADDPDVRVVVLTGAGDRAFSAGADLAPPGGAGPASSDNQPSLEASIDQLQRFQESSLLLHTMHKPTIAAINGAVADASLSMACACDFRVSDGRGKCGTNEVQNGFNVPFPLQEVCFWSCLVCPARHACSRLPSRIHSSPHTVFWPLL